MSQHIKLEEEIQDEGVQVLGVANEGAGKLVYLKGYKYPHKGVPDIEAIRAINLVKTELMRLVKTWHKYLLTPQKALTDFETYAYACIESKIMNLKDMTPFARELHYLIVVGTHDTLLAKIIAHIFEYDGAYRFRVQDVLSETTRERLLADPVCEIGRLLKLYERRDDPRVAEKIGKMVRLGLWALRIPSVRKQFSEALMQIDFSKLQFDENDRYWACYKRDYDYFGLSYEERQRLI